MHLLSVDMSVTQQTMPDLNDKKRDLIPTIFNNLKYNNKARID